MSLTRNQARDEILAGIRTVLLAVSEDISEKNIIFQNSEVGEKPAEDLDPLPSWAEVFVRHNEGNQAAINATVGQRCYDRIGIITIQLFTPRDDMEKADELSEAAEAAFLGVSTPGGVWYKNVRPVEIGASGPWFQTNIIAEFEYTQLR